MIKITGSSVIGIFISRFQIRYCVLKSILHNFEGLATYLKRISQLDFDQGKSFNTYCWVTTLISYIEWDYKCVTQKTSITKAYFTIKT